MLDEIFDYLREFGFTSNELWKFEKENSELFFVKLKDVKDNIDFLLNKKLKKEEIIEIIRNNPFMLTAAKNRREYYDNIYLNILKLTDNELIKLIKDNNDAYTASPIELENIINYLLSNNKEPKNIILSNPKIISMKLDELKKV